MTDRRSLLLGLMAVAAGAALRLDQFLAQVLIDDEWHAVHQVLDSVPARMFFDFGHADYSIPLGMLYWLVAQGPGLSEAWMRALPLACGLALLAAFPLYVARKLSWPVAAVFALLLATSPLLVLYSRIARPYAITLLLAWVAHAAFHRYHAATQRGLGAGATYAGTAALATWLHPIVGPFVIAPFAWAVVALRGQSPATRRRTLLRLLLLALASGGMMAALVLPPLLAHPEALTKKSGVHAPDLATLAGVWHAWFGTPHVPVVAMCLVLVALGARSVWKALPEARTGTLGVLLMAAALLVSKPEHSLNPITTGRYLLPVVPLLLLMLAAGLVRVAGIGAGAARGPSPLRLAAAVAACAALLVPSPLWTQLRRPNSQSLHVPEYFDYRPRHNLVRASMAGIPLSPFWRAQAGRGRGALTIAVAPFHFESYFWDAARWERESGQRVIPGWLGGLCVGARLGEVPAQPNFRFRNAAHLAIDDSLRRAEVDLVVWQKPFGSPLAPNLQRLEQATAHCESALRARFGPSVYEDGMLVAFRVPRGESAAAVPLTGTPTRDR